MEEGFSLYTREATFAKKGDIFQEQDVIGRSLSKANMNTQAFLVKNNVIFFASLYSLSNQKLEFQYEKK